MNFKYLRQSEIKSIRNLKNRIRGNIWAFFSFMRFSMCTYYLNNQNKVINIPTNIFSASTYSVLFQELFCAQNIRLPLRLLLCILLFGSSTC